MQITISTVKETRYFATNDVCLPVCRPAADWMSRCTAAWRLVAARCRLAAALVAVGALLSVAAEAQDKPAISIATDKTTVVGNGTNQVTFTVSWPGTINFDGEPIEIQVDDPDNGLNFGHLRPDANNRIQRSGPSSGRGDITFTATARRLMPGETDRTSTWPSLYFPALPSLPTAAMEA